MPEFYATYDREGQHFLAVVFGPQRPANLQFSSYEELCAAMDALGHEWEMRSAIQDPHEYAAKDTAAWLKRLAEAKALEQEPKPEVNLWGGSFPGANAPW